MYIYVYIYIHMYISLRCYCQKCLRNIMEECNGRGTEIARKPKITFAKNKKKITDTNTKYKFLLIKQQNYIQYLTNIYL